MEFEDMQRIWDKQNQEPLYAVNETALHAKIKSKGSKVGIMVEFVEWGVIIGGLIGGVTMLSDVIEDELGLLAYACVAVVFVAVARIVWLRMGRERQLAQYEQTLLGDLEKAIAQNRYLVEMGTSLFRWFMLPTLSAYIVWFMLTGVPLQLTLLIIFLGVIARIAGGWEMRKWHVPRQNDLEGLRDLLCENE